LFQVQLNSYNQFKTGYTAKTRSNRVIHTKRVIQVSWVMKSANYHDDTGKNTAKTLLTKSTFGTRVKSLSKNRSRVNVLKTE